MNKKPWHPGRMDKQEKLWKKEHERSKVLSKVEDIRKPIAVQRH